MPQTEQRRLTESGDTPTESVGDPTGQEKLNWRRIETLYALGHAVAQRIKDLDAQIKADPSGFFHQLDGLVHDVCSVNQEESVKNLRYRLQELDGLDDFNFAREPEHHVSHSSQVPNVLEDEIRALVEEGSRSRKFETMSRLAKDSNFPLKVSVQVATKVSSHNDRIVSSDIVFEAAPEDSNDLGPIQCLFQESTLRKSWLEYSSGRQAKWQETADQIKQWLISHEDETFGRISVHESGPVSETAVMEHVFKLDSCDQLADPGWGYTITKRVSTVRPDTVED